MFLIRSCVVFYKYFVLTYSLLSSTEYLSVMVHLSSFLLKNIMVGMWSSAALGGATNRPFYRIVAAYNKRARDSKYIERWAHMTLSQNTQNEKLVAFNYERIKYWMHVGLIRQNQVAKLLGLLDFPLHPMTVTEAERRQKAALTEEVKNGQSTTSGAEGAL
ncbi:hypothetical protein cypCar_00045001 [Cyprinus carpio]|nr:hypothetical protein cypCar_00045001 [Cyprinus carpio]